MPLVTDIRNIKLAYRNIKRNAGSKTAGVDKKTIEKWEKSGTTAYINYVRHRLNNYQPQKIRRVEIPKDNGKTRPLGIPTIGDRLIQQCIKQVLEPICEAKFHRSSYGFRPNRSAHHAIAEMYYNVQIRNLYHIVDIDIKGFFDNVNHGKLLKQMWNLGIRDKNLLCVISKMLKAEIHGIGIPDKGTPQGGILSPLLSNIVLNELDWWISNQFETFKTKRKYAVKNNSEYIKYMMLRNTTKLKEIYILRYADDFKLFCRSKKMAERAFIATQLWLKDRLGLEISPEKSKIIDIRSETSNFLGFEISTQNPRKKKRAKQREYVIESHMSEKAKKKSYELLKKKIVAIQKSPSAKTVMRYNATVLGLQQYYKIASHVNIDMNNIAFLINRSLHNRLKKVWAKNGVKGETYKRLYSNNYKTHFIGGIAIYPLGDIVTEKPIRFKQSINNYTESGRVFVHQSLQNFNTGIISYIMRNTSPSSTVEMDDNKISKYVAQYGKCNVSGAILSVGNMELHHVIPKNMGGTDEYRNLVWVLTDVHTLIHATRYITIYRLINRLKLSSKDMKSLNQLRLKAGNFTI
jgi:group II intron reverse transcriptase/maturase